MGELYCILTNQSIYHNLVEAIHCALVNEECKAAMWVGYNGPQLNKVVCLLQHYLLKTLMKLLKIFGVH